MKNPATTLPAEWRDQATQQYDPTAARILEDCADALESQWQAYTDELLSIPEAANESGFSYQTIYRQVETGKLAAEGPPGKRRIRRRHLPRKGL